MADFEIVEHRVHVGELTFNVAEIGSGPPVILLHGWPDSWRLWREQMVALAQQGHRVIAPDLRGFGDSDHPEAVEEYSMSTLIGDVVAIMDEFRIERATVVGHDWGQRWRGAERVADDRIGAVRLGTLVLRAD